MLKLHAKSLDWALKHIETFGDTDIFPVPFEYKAIRHCWDSDLKPYLLKQDITNWQTRTHRRCLTPKHRFGFRIATQLDPLDTIIFTALIAEIGKDIEAARIPASESIAFSYRFKPSSTGEMYDSSYGYSDFRNQCEFLSLIHSDGYVVVADIADFYPRIYSHPLENALDACTTQKAHSNTIKKLLKSWNFTASYGIPVGMAASRLLAELVLDDIDRGLVSEGTSHCRFVDDFRIFCGTEKEAHEKLARLAHLLYENLSLTLQQHKTMIIPTETFREKFLDLEDKRELSHLSAKFNEILDEAGISNPYETIEYDDLDPGLKEKVDNLNLIEILQEQINQKNELDIPLVRFVLHRLGQFDDIEGLRLAIKNIDVLYPVFTDVIKYCQNIRSLNTTQRQKIGKILLSLLNSSLVGHLEFHKLWILDTFTKDTEWDNQNTFTTLYSQYADKFSRREIILALGRARNHTWFKSNKRDINNFGPWEKNAFIAAASCLPGDEYTHWLRSIYGSLDPLEKAIGKWATDNRF